MTKVRGHFDENGFWVDDPPDPETTDVEGQKLAQLITEACEWRDYKVSLTGPAQFNATGKRGVAMIANLIGLEEFWLRGAYLANGKDLVLTLAPAGAEKFRFIEVPVGDALDKFNGMRTALDSIFKKDSIETLAGLRRAQLAAVEELRLKEKAGQYDDNFGAW